MQEKTIKNIALIVTVLGLIGLFFLVENFDMHKEFNLDDFKVDEEIRLQGEISKITATDKVMFIQMLNHKVEPMDIILFPEEDLPLKAGDYIETIGTTEEYNGKKEVIANKVTLK